ncbi:MAG: methylenetetrahydrofolate--tRNA-(uracil(54)-C(5))-methyltransferase (FADH(2)-oxidizing) TrmFO [Chrysiogenetes bacterium]|nr:methylenetetrahydrofolate--tRNA-(uracil(54)-C(5))-methyltransferase (FADH(2)-oxidizing) TrmFO [Chrysiogenetes bacterium]
MSEKRAIVVGGGLSGAEAAWRLARRGIACTLFEMRPVKPTEAHQSDRLAEIVCSNSLKSDRESTPQGLLKEELRALGSLILECAQATRVPAGDALAVDRDEFAALVTKKIEEEPLIELRREEFTELPTDVPVILATGPLTSGRLAQSLADITGTTNLAFYDAISPIVEADSINRDIVFSANRHDRGESEDYLNIPMSEEEYHAFVSALLEAGKVPYADFENIRPFEACQPIEEIASKGTESLRFGTFRAIGLTDPRTGRRPYAVAQLRAENRAFTLYNLVGCQTKMRYGEQERVFRMLPGLEAAEFVRLGSVHRNTFVNAPLVLDEALRIKAQDNLYIGGQLTGVEGYVEAVVMGLIAAENVERSLRGAPPVLLPANTAIGALQRYLREADPEIFQPMNFNFGLFDPLEKRARGKAERRLFHVERAREEMAKFLGEKGGIVL